MTNVPGLFCRVPGARNARNTAMARIVPGVPGVTCLCAPTQYVRDINTRTHPRVRDALYTRNTRNTKNKVVVDSVLNVLGTRNKEKTTRNITMSQSKKPFRDSMPLVFEFISAVRDVMGPEVNDAIRAGIDGQPTFYAKENGVEVGTPMDPAAFVVTGDALFAHKPQVTEKK